MPNLNNLKDQMIATKWKVWKYAFGTHYYWNKLCDSVQMAERHTDELEAFRREQNQKLQSISMENNPVKQEEAKAEYRDLFAGRAAVAFMKKSPMTKSLEQAIGQYRTGNKKQIKDLISEQVQVMKNQSYLTQELEQYKKTEKQSEHAKAFANTKTTADRVSGRINKVSGLVGKFNKVVKYGKKVAKHIPPAKEILAKVNQVTPYTNLGGTLLGIINSTANLAAISKRNESFNHVLENYDVDDPRMKSLAELGKKLNKVERKQNIGNLISGGYFTASGIYSILSLGIPFVGPILSGIGFVTSYGKMIHDKNLINRKRHTTVVDHELLGGEEGINRKAEQYDKKLEERQKRYPAGSKQYKAIAGMRANRQNMKDRLRNDHVAKDGNVHLSDSYMKQLKKIRQEVFSQIYYVDPKKKENPEYITDSNYKEHYKKDTDEYRKRVSYQELLRGFKNRRQDFNKLKSKEDVQKLESKIVKGK